MIEYSANINGVKINFYFKYISSNKYFNKKLKSFFKKSGYRYDLELKEFLSKNEIDVFKEAIEYNLEVIGQVLKNIRGLIKDLTSINIIYNRFYISQDVTFLDDISTDTDFFIETSPLFFIQDIPGYLKQKYNLYERSLIKAGFIHETYNVLYHELIHFLDMPYVKIMRDTKKQLAKRFKSSNIAFFYQICYLIRLEGFARFSMTSLTKETISFGKYFEYLELLDKFILKKFSTPKDAFKTMIELKGGEIVKEIGEKMCVIIALFIANKKYSDLAFIGDYPNDLYVQFSKSEFDGVKKIISRMDLDKFLQTYEIACKKLGIPNKLKGVTWSYYKSRVKILYKKYQEKIEEKIK